MINLFILFFYVSFNVNAGFSSSSFYIVSSELKVVPKGLNTGVSFKKGDIGLRGNIEFLKGGWKEYFYWWGEYIRKTDYKEISSDISILSYLTFMETNVYISFGIFYSYINYKFKKIYLGDSISKDEKYHGNLLGFPLILGLEKKIFKNIYFYGELYAFFYGILSLKWHEENNTFKADYLISGGWYPFHLFEEGKLGKIRMGIKYEL